MVYIEDIFIHLMMIYRISIDLSRIDNLYLISVHVHRGLRKIFPMKGHSLMYFIRLHCFE